jgi:hypothetical protein
LRQPSGREGSVARALEDPEVQRKDADRGFGGSAGERVDPAAGRRDGALLVAEVEEEEEAPVRASFDREPHGSGLQADGATPKGLGADHDADREAEGGVETHGKGTRRRERLREAQGAHLELADFRLEGLKEVG